MHSHYKNQNLSPAIAHRRWLELAVFLLIVMVGVASRHWLIDIPNFKPVAALCLFAGFFFRRYSVALLAMVCIMLISDWQLGSYPWPLALAVYGSLGLAVGLGWLVKKQVDQGASGPSGRQWVAFGLCSLTMSTTFFLLTNLAFWQFSGLYPSNVGGLVGCFLAAVPFYRWTLMGDLTFTLVIFGIYQLGCVVALRLSHLPRLVTTS